ncbi:hypothetical protein ONZ45_g16302 [Pleurotus djamor]|nr:hypothetical protein ONZ45_g16302 [Pleurotus djamor]
MGRASLESVLPSFTFPLKGLLYLSSVLDWQAYPMTFNYKNLVAFVTAVVFVAAVNVQARIKKIAAREDSVTAFYAVNYGGQAVSVPTSVKGACQDVAAGDNDQISSIRLIPDTDCIFYTAYNCSGTLLAVIQDIPDLRLFNFNDVISSFNCYTVVATGEDLSCPVGV